MTTQHTKAVRWTLLTIILVLAPLMARLAYAEKTNLEKKQTMSKAELQIRQTLETHLNGIINKDVSKLQKAWNSNGAQVQFIKKNKKGIEVLTSSPAEEVFKLWTKPTTKKTSGKILSVDIFKDKMAVAKLEIKWQGSTYTDFLSLFKINGEWKIVNKTFVGESKGTKAPVYG